MPPALTRRLLPAGAMALLPAAARANAAAPSATEALSRQHGLLRRVLLVQEALAQRLRGEGGRFDPTVLREMAQLHRRFAEGFHGQLLEEEQVFPFLERQGGPLAALCATLRAQHARGREITAFVLDATREGLRPGAQQLLANALDNQVRMLSAHAAREDSEVFPAFRRGVSEAQYTELAERFAALEQREFGPSGLEALLRQVAQAEQALGLADLAGFTAPPPPRR